MTKYKIVGLINLLLGVSQLLISITFPLIVIPKLTNLYSNLNVDVQPNFTGAYVALIILLLTAFTNLFIGIRSTQKSKNKDKYFKYGIISAIVTFFVTGILVAILNMSIISPMYNLTSQF